MREDSVLQDSEVTSMWNLFLNCQCKLVKLRHGSVILDKIISHDCVREFLNDADPISDKSYVIIVQKEKCDVDKSHLIVRHSSCF